MKYLYKYVYDISNQFRTFTQNHNYGEKIIPKHLSG